LYSYEAVFPIIGAAEFYSTVDALKELRTVYLLIFSNFDSQVKRNRAMLASNPARDILILTE
jgi:hypothetical protein